MSYRKWDVIEDDWLKSNGTNYKNYDDLTDAFNLRFKSRTRDSIKIRMLKHHRIITGRETGKPYEDTEVRYILDNYKSKPLSELVDGLSILTGRKASISAVGHYMSDVLSVGRFGRNSRIQKGERIGYVADIGTESINADGYVFIKISDTGIKNADWKTKQAVIWEKTHGKPPNGVVIFLNGDKTDFSAENLYCVDRKIHGVMCLNRWYTESREHTLTAIKWCELQYAIKNINA